MSYSHPYKPNPDRHDPGHPYAPGGTGNSSASRSFEDRVDEFSRRVEEKVSDLDQRVEEWSRRADERYAENRGAGSRKSRRGRGSAPAGESLDDLVDRLVDFGTNLGSGILGTISDALSSAGRGHRSEELTFPVWRKRAERRLRGDIQIGGMVLAVVGGILTFSFGVAGLVMLALTFAGPTALSLSAKSYAVIPMLMAVFLAVTTGFGVMTGMGIRLYRYYLRLSSYLRASHDWTEDIPALARATGCQPAQVSRDLTKAAGDGKLPGVFLSSDRNTVYFREEDFLQAQQGRAGTAAAGQQAAEDAGDAAGTMTPAEQFQHHGRAFLEYLSSCRGKLDDAADEELVRMDRTCGAILDFIRDHPEQLGRMRRFSDYYLPTTRKLLDTALNLGPVEAENARTIRRDITGILHTLNTAYLKLYDTLLQDISLDVSTEIDTLESMLRQDGLAGGFDSDFGAAAPK